MIWAHKGFDGVHLRFDALDGTVLAATICEDKATVHPTQTIRGDVWPDFQRIESGDREHLLVSEVSTLLATVPDIDTDQIIKTTLWEPVRHYRIAITVGEKEHSDIGRQRLFAGYENAVKGPNVARRRAETFYQQELRSWLCHIAHLAVAALEDL